MVWANGGRGIEAAGAQPTSYVTIRNNTALRRQHPAAAVRGLRDRELGNGNTVANNIAILGPGAQNGTAANQTTVAIADRCGPSSAGVQITGGSTWANNIVYAMSRALRSTSQLRRRAVDLHDHPHGLEPHGGRPWPGRGDVDGHAHGAGFTIGSSPATHAGTGTNFARSTTRTSRARFRRPSARSSRSGRRRVQQMGGCVIDLPELDGAAMSRIDRNGASFWSAIHDAAGAHVLAPLQRERARLWLGRCYKAFGSVADVLGDRRDAGARRARPRSRTRLTARRTERAATGPAVRARSTHRYGIRTLRSGGSDYSWSVKSYGQFCSVARTLDLLGERWTLLIVRELLSGSAPLQRLSTGHRRISRTYALGAPARASRRGRRHPREGRRQLLVHADRGGTGTRRRRAPRTWTVGAEVAPARSRGRNSMANPSSGTCGAACVPRSYQPRPSS